MNKILIVVFVSLSIGYCGMSKQKLDMPHYIEIKHVGVEQKFVKPLFISTKALNI